MSARIWISQAAFRRYAITLGGPEIQPMVRDFFDRVLKAKQLPPNLGPAKNF